MYIYYVYIFYIFIYVMLISHLTSVVFEHSVCHESLPTSFTMLLAFLVEDSLVRWYQQCVTVHHLSKSMSYTK